MPRTKRELKRLYTDLDRKTITDDMAHILIDLCYNEKQVMRTSGFYWPGGPDVIMTWSNTTRTLTLTPREPDPGGTGADKYVPYFRFYSWAGEPVLNRIKEVHEIQLPDQEGLFAVYFDVDPETGLQKLFYIKNPEYKDQVKILIKKVAVSYIYWDYENQKAQIFGNDKHGSEVNPHQQLINHNTEFAKRNDDRELQIYGYILNADGSSDDHVRYKVSPGDIWHDDIKLFIPDAGISEEIPVLYFDNGRTRIIQDIVPVAYTTQLCYNPGGNSLVAALDNAYVMYHVFATNDKLDNQHIIAVVGRKQFGSAAKALDERIKEVLTIREEMPQTGKCYLGSVVYHVLSTFTNTPHARMVTACNSSGGGLIINVNPITVDIESNEYFIFNQYNEFTFNFTLLINNITNIFNKYIDVKIEENNEYITNLFNDKLAEGKYSDIIITDLSTYIYTTVWGVSELNERMGEFKTTVIIHDLSDDSTYHLQSILGFDYIDGAHEVWEQNNTITDGTVTLTLRVNDDDMLEAQLDLMPDNTKRIHFCFERCVLADDELAEAEGMFELDADGELAAWLNLEGDAEFELNSEGELSEWINLETEAEFELDGEAEISDYNSLDIDGDFELDGEAEISEQVGIEAEAEFELEGTAEADDASIITEYPEADYSLLYNFPALESANILAPTGYRVATLSDVVELLEYLGGEAVAGGKLKETSVWNSPNTGATDEAGFAAIPAGYRSDVGEFLNKLLKNRIWIDNR